MSHKIYVASSWRNLYQPRVVALLRQYGHTVYDFHHPKPGNDGFRWEQIDPEWELWNMDGYRRALRHPIAENGYELDMSALDRSDVVVLLLPSGASAHSEAAFHCGKGKPVIVHSPEKCQPELMYKMFNAITESDVELIKILTFDRSALNYFSLVNQEKG